MNERVGELARMSGLNVDSEESFSEFAEKTRLSCFAELIVGECCDVIERRYKYSNGTPMSFWEMSQDVQDLLKKHFGVER